MSRPLRIAYLGNFSVSFSTESDVAWTLENMGHTVARLQENKATPAEIMRQTLGCDMFLWTHTPGWSDADAMDQVTRELHAHGVPTAGLHLDLYWGLAREKMISAHPFWKLRFVFTADGAHQPDFARLGINHHWLPPAVAERWCYRGTRRPELAFDVVFIGSRSYHREYPFRAELVDWLQDTYGGRFRRFNGDTTGVVREGKLNDLYASVRVVVGDSCFAGIPRYVSDRYFETTGRGGFLLHPKSEGVNVPGVVHYAPQDLGDLGRKIEYYLANDGERCRMQNAAFEWVRQHDTYTNRVMTMLETVGLR